MQITTHTELLNALIEKYNLKSYLEIGVQNPSNNFDEIFCYWKVGIDPEWTYNPDSGVQVIGTSDDYFSSRPEEADLFDLIFIDGLHHADQVKRDFENSLRCLSDNGFIVIHDVLPENEEGTIVPRQTKKWWGTVYQWAMDIKTYDGIGYKTFDIDNGCMLVWKDSSAKMKHQSFHNTWETYTTVGKHLMNVTSTVEI